MSIAPTTSRKIAVSSWVTLAAFVVAIWPLFAHLQQSIALNDQYGTFKSAFDFSAGFNVTQIGFLDSVVLVFAEPVVVIAAVILAFTARNKFVRAIPGALYFLGFVVFLVLNYAYSLQPSDYPVDFWQWTVGYGPDAYPYVASILLALAGSIIALREKPEAPIAGVSAGPGAVAPGSTPIGYDTQTGRPIYGYDVNTGEPILG